LALTEPRNHGVDVLEDCAAALGEAIQLLFIQHGSQWITLQTAGESFDVEPPHGFDRRPTKPL
jgi:hypothetical protein